MKLKIKGLVILAATFTLVFPLLWQFSKSTTFQVAGELVTKIETDEKIIALTFDDGPWSNKRANKVLTELDLLNVKATFFLNGRGIAENPQAAELILKGNHDIGNHSYSHSRMLFLNEKKLQHEVLETNQLIRKLGYSREILFRPPYGQKFVTLPRFLKHSGLTTVMWSIAPDESKEQTASDIATETITQVAPGSIILLHPLNGTKNNSLSALPIIVNELRKQGYRFVRLTEVL
jgi:peptidoglycan/xylan/chitin deacetylase (PgdA/CDA1 family)